MPVYVTETIIWTCVLAFIACMIGGLLMIFGVWEPKDPAVRKWLLRGVVISVVGAVAGFAVRQFAPAPSPPSHEPTQRPQRPRGPGQDTRPREPVPDELGQPPEEPTPGLDQDVPRPSAIPAGLEDWADRELGPRPTLPARIDDDYPSCVAQLRRGQPDESDADEALRCRRELQRFHMEVIVAWYDTKRPYDGKLEAEELALRRSGLQADELAKYNYIIAEMDRLNGEDSSAVNAVHSLEERLLGDIRRCARSKCR